MSARADFFAIDARLWPEICKLGINAAVSYLILARGTGGDQATTSWSVNAVETYSGISRPLARKAIQTLIAGRAIEAVKRGARPQYRLATWAKFTGATESSPADTAAVWCWLPNSLIDGAASETSPIELVRQSQNLPAVWLLVALYGVHDLAAFGGVHWRIVRQQFSREKIGEFGANTVWLFKRDGKGVFAGDKCFEAFHRGREQKEAAKELFDLLSLLEVLGLIQYVPHLVEADNDQAAVIHPFGWGVGEPAEIRLGNATHSAGLAIAGLSSIAEGAVVPARRHLREIQMVGLLRLRYKPCTGATLAWLAKIPEWEAAAEAREAEAAQSYRKRA